MTLFTYTEEALAWIEELQESQVQTANTTQEPPLTRGQKSLAVGQIWTVSPSHGSGATILALITEVNEAQKVMRGLLLSDRIWLASADDIILQKSDVDCEIPLIVCLWNSFPLNQSQLCEHVGHVLPTALQAIACLIEHQEIGGYDCIRLREPPHLYRGISCSQWTISDGHKHFTYLTGSGLTSEDDIRLMVRGALLEATAYLQQIMSNPENNARACWRQMLHAFHQVARRVLSSVPAPTSMESHVSAAIFLTDHVTTRKQQQSLTTADFLPGLAFEAEVPFPPLKLLVEAYLENDQPLCSIVALNDSNEQEIAGVKAFLRLHDLNSHKEEQGATRSTNQDGIIDCLYIPLRPNTQYTLCIEYHDAQISVDWQT